jgi:hypothetical protein
MAYDERLAARVRRVLAGRKALVEKKMMGGLCFMLKGGMCCAVTGAGLSWSGSGARPVSGPWRRLMCVRWRWLADVSAVSC